jgi:acetyl-CoA synthetase
MSYPYQIKSLEDYRNHYKKSVDSPEEFWSEIANHFVWKKKWDQVLNWDFKSPSVKWFEGGKLNITENCLDRHLKDNANHSAIIFEPNNPKEEKVGGGYRQRHNNKCY